MVSSQSVDTGGFRCQSPRRDGLLTQTHKRDPVFDLPCIDGQVFTPKGACNGKWNSDDGQVTRYTEDLEVLGYRHSQCQPEGLVTLG